MSADIPQVASDADDFWWNEFVRRSELAAMLGNLPPDRDRDVPDVDGPDCGSVVHHRAGRCDCNGLQDDDAAADREQMRQWRGIA